MTTSRLFLAAISIPLVFAVARLSVRSDTAAPPAVGDEALARMLKEIRPQPGEDLFDSIPWQISLHDARLKAAKEGKPILLWEMDGHPLGCG